MAELQDVMMFCLLYSGVVLYSLWVTLARTPLRVEAEQRRNKY